MNKLQNPSGELKDLPLQLQVNIIHKGEVIGTHTMGTNDDILSFKREREFNLGHTFEGVVEKAVLQACKTYDSHEDSKD